MSLDVVEIGAEAVARSYLEAKQSDLRGLPTSECAQSRDLGPEESAGPVSCGELFREECRGRAVVLPSDSATPVLACLTTSLGFVRVQSVDPATTATNSRSGNRGPWSRYGLRDDLRGDRRLSADLVVAGARRERRR